MSFIAGVLIGLALPKGVRYVREHPDAIHGGVLAVKRMFGR